MDAPAVLCLRIWHRGVTLTPSNEPVDLRVARLREALDRLCREGAEGTRADILAQRIEILGLDAQILQLDEDRVRATKGRLRRLFHIKKVGMPPVHAGI